MKLVSDFHDFYDHCFDGHGPEFRRLTTEGPNKKDQFALLQAAGFLTPPHGKVKEVGGSYWEAENRSVRDVVVYEDLQAHCGQGKRVVRKCDYAFDGNVSRLPTLHALGELFCSAYVASAGPHGYWQPHGPSVSWRLLQIGPHRFWVEYRSTDDWRSNCGTTVCALIGAEKDVGLYPRLEGYKLFAIDFVIGKHLYAIDFNVAPGLRGTGVEAMLRPRELVKALSC